MDIVSHGLWTNVIFLTARRRDRWWAVAFALLPDLLALVIVYVVIGFYWVRRRRFART